MNSTGRPAAESQGGGTGGRVGRGDGRGRRPREGNDEHVDELNGQGNDQGMKTNWNVGGANGGAPDFPTIIAQQLQNLLPTMLARVSNQGNARNQNGNVVNENVQENVRNVLVNGNRVGCSYKEFLACIPKDYDGKGSAVVLTRAGHVAYTDRFHEFARMVAATEPKTMQKVVQISGALTDEAIRNGSIKKVEKRGNIGEPSKDRNARDDNKRTRTGNAFATAVNPIRRENVGAWPKSTTCNSYHAPGGPCRTCFNCNRPGHMIMSGQLVLDGIGYKDREETVQTKLLLITRVMVMETKGTRLGVGHSCWDFVSTTFIPLLGIEPSELGFKYEIEIASGQLVEIDKVIKGCKLEIEGHVFDFDLIPFGHVSFDMIIGMDWLSNHKAEIICHKKIVRIPLPDGNVLRVLGERPIEKVRFLMGVKNQEKIVVVRNFLEVFPDDLPGLPPSREIEFIPRAKAGCKVSLSIGAF
ncbi:putative reverse transcriptase domain-containing protein [Tanacetum coccineum]